MKDHQSASENREGVMQRIILAIGFVAAGSLAANVQAQQDGRGGPLLVPPVRADRNPSPDSRQRRPAADTSAVRALHDRRGRYDPNDWNRRWDDGRDRDYGDYGNPPNRWDLSPFAPYNPGWSEPRYANWRDGIDPGNSHGGYHRHDFQNLHDGHGHWRSPRPGPVTPGPRIERTLDLIAGWYRVYMGRSLTRWEARKWVDDLERGMSRQEIFATILSSADWYQRAGGSARRWIQATLASLGELDAGALPQWLVRLQNVGGDRRAVADQMVARYGVRPARRVRPTAIYHRDHDDSQAERRRERRRQRRRRQRRRND